MTSLPEHITVHAIGGKIHIYARPQDLSIEQADELANAVAEAQLVAMEQRVRARALARRRGLSEYDDSFASVTP